LKKGRILYKVIAMAMRIVRDKISLQDLKEIAQKQFGYMVKAVVDIERKIIAVGGELHADEEVLLSEDGSKRENVWGINLHLEKSKEDWVEFDSMINIKPQFKNRSRSVEDVIIQEKIKSIVNEMVVR
jgi:hypothetical protein